MPPRLSRLSHRLFVCPSCQIQASASARYLSTTRIYLTSNETPTFDLPRVIPKHTQLTSRNLIKLTGRDAGKFIDDLLPAKVLNRESETKPIYTAFLNAHGRILNDVFIYPPSKEQEKSEPWYIEVDVESTGFLMQHLRKHKLRSKFVLDRIPQETLAVYYTWPGGEQEDATHRLGGSDPRPGMGSRWIMAPEQAPKDIEGLFGSKGVEMRLEDYTVHRMLNGVAEGQSELKGMIALPQQSNIEFFGGVDFQKGCYLGQELTIRTHHTGVVRKRILPCQIYDDQHPIEKDQEAPVYNANTGLEIPPSESHLTRLSTKGKARSVGNWMGGVGNIGLALCRLEIVSDIQLTGEGAHYDPNEEFKVGWENGEDGKPTKEVKVKPIMLPWLRR